LIKQLIHNHLQGVGGILQPEHYFALWLNDDCKTGKSQTMTTTYQSPVLSSSETFELDSIEIWATENIAPVVEQMDEVEYLHDK
jgi:hypothetical protein